MARVLGNPMGELRGKLAGSVYSRNRAGQFVRGYVHPAQANSQAQLDARASFGTASQLWRSLNSVNKQSYNNFAVAVYNPLTKTNTGQFTGQQTFIGINQSAQISQNKTIPGDFALTPGGASLAKTDIAFQAPLTAPALSVQPTVPANGSGLPIPLGVACLGLTTAGIMDLQLTFGATGVGIATGDLRDGNGKPFAVGVYCSDTVPFSGATPKNKWNKFLGNTPVPNFTTNLTAGLLTLYWDGGGNVWNNFKSAPQVGEWVLLTFIVIGADGTQATVGSAYQIVT